VIADLIGIFVLSGPASVLPARHPPGWPLHSLIRTQPL